MLNTLRNVTTNLVKKVFNETTVVVTIKREGSQFFNVVTGNVESILDQYSIIAIFLSVNSTEVKDNIGLILDTDKKLIIDMEEYSKYPILPTDLIVIGGIEYSVIREPKMIPNSIATVVVIVYLRARV